MIIFSEHTSPRISYALNYVFNIQLGLSYKLTSNTEEFIESKQFKINYSSFQFEHVFQIVPEGLLFENIIRSKYPILSQVDNLPIIFQQKSGNIPFDIFSALFWFLSRYEEYMEFTPDAHDRFPATESFAYKNSILASPIIDEWINYFRDILQNTFDGIELKCNTFRAVTTIDVDSPWCYKNKGLLRNVVGLIRDLITININSIVLRLKVLLNKIPDPWYNFEWLLKLHDNTKTQLMFFVHVGDYGRYDKTVNYKLKAFSSFIDTINSRAEVSIHPSYKASTKKDVLKEELDRLSKLTGKKVVKSRQHFLVFALPTYYRMLIELGVEDDFSMGFADKPGFRAGTSNSFYFFDLENNRETNLKIHPFAVMDRTLSSYEGESVQKASETINNLIENVKKVDGTFVSLWHNESLSNRFEWKGWRAVFNDIFNNIND